MNTYEITFTRENGSTGYICPHCESRLRSGYTLKDIQANRKERPQMTKGATP